MKLKNVNRGEALVLWARMAMEAAHGRDSRPVSAFQVLRKLGFRGRSRAEVLQDFEATLRRERIL